MEIIGRHLILTVEKVFGDKHEEVVEVIEAEHGFFEVKHNKAGRFLKLISHEKFAEGQRLMREKYEKI